jgi:GT2 family glycosyltransferase
MKPEVSIIIVNYNTFYLTVKSINSIKEKTKDVTYEIILVDNGSSECDAEEFKNIFQDIILIKSEKNLGFAKACNLGIKKSSSEVILLLNSDTELINNAIKLAYDKLMEDSKIAVVSGALYNYDNTIQKQINKQESIKLILIELLRIHKLLPTKIKAKLLQGSYFNHEQEMFTDKVWGTFFMFRKKLLESFPENKLHETFFMYGEDVEWCYFIRNNLKLKILYYPYAKVCHLGGGSNFNSNKIETQIKHRYQILRKYHSRLYLKLFGILKYLQLHIESKKNGRNIGLNEQKKYIKKFF